MFGSVDFARHGPESHVSCVSGFSERSHGSPSVTQVMTLVLFPLPQDVEHFRTNDIRNYNHLIEIFVYFLYNFITGELEKLFYFKILYP